MDAEFDESLEDPTWEFGVSVLVTQSAFVADARGIPSLACLMKNSPHPNAGKLLTDYFISEEGRKIFQAGDYITVDAKVPPREASLSPSIAEFSMFYFTS